MTNRTRDRRVEEQSAGTCRRRGGADYRRDGSRKRRDRREGGGEAHSPKVLAASLGSKARWSWAGRA